MNHLKTFAAPPERNFRPSLLHEGLKFRSGGNLFSWIGGHGILMAKCRYYTLRYEKQPRLGQRLT